MKRSVISFSGLIALASSASADKRWGSDLPTVKLPYGTYQATEYDRSSDSYIFRDIRFAAPPTGDLRFAKPASPHQLNGTQNGGEGFACPQLLPGGIIANALPALLAKPIGSLLSAVPDSLVAGADTSEDCLFLDVHVPARAIKDPKLKLPVLNWIYGGAYLLGSKNQSPYDGTPLLKASSGSIIYVAANYRLGPWGFLAGTTVEKDKSVVANAGFWDQRAALEWINKYISLFGGNPADVTAMGESAGAGSILHHITAFGGKQDPLFQKAIIQSPAFGPFTWDRIEANERTFQAFEIAAGCAGQGIACLKTKDISVIKSAGLTVANSRAGQFGFGPAADGGFVRQNPNLEIAAGKYAPQVKRLILSHTTKESDMFVPQITDDQPEAEFREEHDWEYGNNTAITNAISQALPRTAFETARERSLDAVAKARFTCSIRSLTSAYKGATYNIIYEGQHGDDVSADFYVPWSVSNAVSTGSVPSTQKQQYQAYIVSFARTGDPNKYKLAGSPTWPIAQYGPTIGQVLSVNKTISVVPADALNTEKDCSLWYNVWAAATDNAGLAPPDAVVKTNIPIKAGNPSRNYAK